MNKHQTAEQVVIQPSGELRVRKPNSQLLEPSGETVTWNSYWRRRELDGDIKRVDEKPTRSDKRSVKAAIPSDTSE